MEKRETSSVELEAGNTAAFWSDPGRLAVIDFETTMSWDGLRAVELAVVLVENGAIQSSRSRLIRPSCRIDPFSQSVHGIRDVDVQDAPSFSEVWEEMADLFAGSVLVAHNASFDSRVLAAEFERNGITPAELNWWCTLRLARRLWKGQFHSYRLAVLCEELRLPARCTHRAVADAHAALEVLRSGCLEAQTRGFTRLAELEALARYAPKRRIKRGDGAPGRTTSSRSRSIHRSSASAATRCPSQCGTPLAGLPFLVRAPLATASRL